MATSEQSPVCGCCQDPQVALGEMLSNFSRMMSGGACTNELSPDDGTDIMMRIDLPEWSQQDHRAGRLGKLNQGSS